MPSSAPDKFKRKADAFHDAELKNWEKFEKDLRSKGFQKALLEHGVSDETLKSYVQHYGDFVRSKKVVATVPSYNSRRTYRIKRLPSGRLGCSCGDWQYKRSHKGTDCKHIETFQATQKVASMSHFDPLVLRSFRMELEKISARRGLKEIRKMVAAGHGEQAAALARKPGVLKPTPHGHQVKDIGKGSEGLATLTAGPEHGLAVRKTYDPQGIASPELIARKEQAGKALQNNPHVARFHGSQQGVGGTTAHTMEYVPGQEPKVSPQTHAAMRAARQGVAQGMRQAGFAGAADVRPANMIQTPQGAVKAIDYIPTRAGEFASGNQRAQFNKILQAKGKQPLGKNTQVQVGDTSPLQSPGAGMSAGQLKALHFRGAQPVAPAPAAPPVGAPTNAMPNRALPSTQPMKPPAPLGSTVLSRRPAL